MPYVMNASSQEQQVKVHGAWFTFKPKQIKDMHDDKVAFLASNCAYLGFVQLPEAISDLDRQSPEAKAIIREAEEKGIRNRISFLEQLKKNEIVALQRDIDKSGQKYDARLEMNDDVLKQLEELAQYKTSKQDAAQARVDRIKALEAQLEETE